jgi:hypothetical protein
MVTAVDESGGGNNGTFVNGVRVQEHVLRSGDLIGFGKGRSVPLRGQIQDKNLEVGAHVPPHSVVLLFCCHMPHSTCTDCLCMYARIQSSLNHTFMHVFQLLHHVFMQINYLHLRHSPCRKLSQHLGGSSRPRPRP